MLCELCPNKAIKKKKKTRIAGKALEVELALMDF